MSSNSAVSAAANYAPWRKGIAWWIVLIQGLILTGLGAYALLRTEAAIYVILIGIALYLIAMGIWLIIQAMRGSDSGFSIFGLLASGGGLTAGIALVMPLLLIPDVQGRTLMVAFGFAMVTVGALALLGALLERRSGGFSWMAILRSAAYLLLGIALVASVWLDSEQILLWIAWIVLIMGVVLIVLSILLYRSQHEDKVEAAKPAAT